MKRVWVWLTLLSSCMGISWGAASTASAAPPSTQKVALLMVWKGAFSAAWQNATGSGPGPYEIYTSAENASWTESAIEVYKRAGSSLKLESWEPSVAVKGTYSYSCSPQAGATLADCVGSPPAGYVCQARALPEQSFQDPAVPGSKGGAFILAGTLQHVSPVLASGGLTGSDPRSLDWVFAGSSNCSPGSQDVRPAWVDQGKARQALFFPNSPSLTLREPATKVMNLKGSYAGPVNQFGSPPFGKGSESFRDTVWIKVCLTGPDRCKIPPNELCIAPDLVGTTLSQAKSLLRQAGCELGGVTRVRSKKTKRGLVISQSPGADVPAPKGVSLVLSRGP